MLTINYPEPGFRVKKEGDKELIFDSLRKKWLVLTPEEWVRQNFIQFLIQVKGYPSSLIAIEKEIQLGELKKRFDILVYNKDHQPWLMVECKTMDIAADEKVLEQILRYNIALPVSVMIITNGHYTYAWEKKDTGLQILSEFPAWPA